MNKLKILRATNLLLLISFVVQAMTSLVLFFEWDVPFAWELSSVHKYNGLLMIILAFVHVVLNWGWMRANFFKKRVK